MIYLNVYLVRRCNFTWDMGHLALITDYWNDAKFKQKHLVANLPASPHRSLREQVSNSRPLIFETSEIHPLRHGMTFVRNDNSGIPLAGKAVVLEE